MYTAVCIHTELTAGIGVPHTVFSIQTCAPVHCSVSHQCQLVDQLQVRGIDALIPALDLVQVPVPGKPGDFCIRPCLCRCQTKAREQFFRGIAGCCDGVHQGTALECIRRKQCRIAEYGNAVQSGAVCKCTVANACQGCRQYNGGQLVCALECGIPDGSHGIKQVHMLD